MPAKLQIHPFPENGDVGSLYTSIPEDGVEVTNPDPAVVMVIVQNRRTHGRRIVCYQAEQGTESRESMMTLEPGGGTGQFAVPGPDRDGPVKITLTVRKPEGLVACAVAMPPSGTTIRHRSPGIGPLPPEEG